MRRPHAGRNSDRGLNAREVTAMYRRQRTRSRHRSHPLLKTGAGDAIRRSPNGAVRSVHRAGRDRLERVVAIVRNGWSRSIGIGGRNHSVRAQRAPAVRLNSCQLVYHAMTEAPQLGAREGMTNDRKYHDGKSPLKTYVSPRVAIRGDDALCIASKVFDSATDFDHVVEKESAVLHATHGGRREIVAKFWENERGLQVVTIRAYRDDRSSGAIHFSFVGGQIKRLSDFLASIRVIPITSDDAFSFTDFDLSRLKISQEQLKELLRGNAALLAEIVRTEVTIGDVQALGYRREQLRKFERLLREP